MCHAAASTWAIDLPAIVHTRVLVVFGSIAALGAALVVPVDTALINA